MNGEGTHIMTDNETKPMSEYEKGFWEEYPDGYPGPFPEPGERNAEEERKKLSLARLSTEDLINECARRLLLIIAQNKGD